ncbi:MAG: metal-dependent transcriptional regulator [Endomicrobium sp.]|jgi:DtxR family Mn-dependent transcriptional regulator|nr:metal-dependent transcriptional regulator [Endomicrobium sp.]
MDINLKKRKCFNNLSASLENYLETIAALKKGKKCTRIGDVAKSLNVRSSSVNVAINFLTENGFVIHEKYGYVDLTEEGEKIALEIQKKHDILYRFINNLLFINGKTANKEACQIEHLVGTETIRRLKKLYILLEKSFLSKKEDAISLKEYLEKQ